MRKLLSANFARLFMSKVFWTLESICLIFGVISYVLVAVNTNNIGQSWLLYNAHFYFFLFVMYIGVIMAVLSGFFVGTEYAEGTIRNKLAVGHSRKNIYFANLLVVCVAGVLFCVPHMLSAFLVGLATVGRTAIMGIVDPLWRIICLCIVIVAYGAVFTAFALLDSSKTRSAIVSMTLALLLIGVGFYVYGRLQEPELTSQMVMQEDGSFQLRENIPNSRYISGTIRSVYEFVDYSLPFSQALHIWDKDGAFEWKAPICLIGLSLLITVVGIRVFQKKDIR